ncbi:hypothetical protein NADFUDRAFT_50744 [Nadsonia fulvescens var. elongata DSM 6958]|uniref:Protein Zds1 C-terminal domain-containing protein n=1 Tax=Nadsonia fulvescens var. elongata DSM 6958 TaxID=857566 RepID=A0A1E3PNG5_9ASCO|nr:hypothetical protein NADFUDRAFT_50744 [Nadsonia fulvescens var. elongata DSM 6958]
MAYTSEEEHITEFIGDLYDTSSLSSFESSFRVDPDDGRFDMIRSESPSPDYFSCDPPVNPSSSPDETNHLIPKTSKTLRSSSSSIRSFESVLSSTVSDVFPPDIPSVSAHTNAPAFYRSVTMPLAIPSLTIPQRTNQQSHRPVYDRRSISTPNSTNQQAVSIVQQELKTLQELKRLSIGALGLTSDPEFFLEQLPNSERLSGEIAPLATTLQRHRSLTEKTQRLSRSSSLNNGYKTTKEGSLPDWCTKVNEWSLPPSSHSTHSSIPSDVEREFRSSAENNEGDDTIPPVSLARKNSRLSKQIKDPDEYTDGSEILQKNKAVDPLGCQTDDQHLELYPTSASSSESDSALSLSSSSVSTSNTLSSFAKPSPFHSLDNQQPLGEDHEPLALSAPLNLNRAVFTGMESADSDLEIVNKLQSSLNDFCAPISPPPLSTKSPSITRRRKNPLSLSLEPKVLPPPPSQSFSKGFNGNQNDSLTPLSLPSSFSPSVGRRPVSLRPAPISPISIIKNTRSVSLGSPASQSSLSSPSSPSSPTFKKFELGTRKWSFSKESGSGSTRSKPEKEKEKSKSKKNTWGWLKGRLSDSKNQAEQSPVSQSIFSTPESNEVDESELLGLSESITRKWPNPESLNIMPKASLSSVECPSPSPVSPVSPSSPHVVKKKDSLKSLFAFGSAKDKFTSKDVKKSDWLPSSSPISITETNSVMTTGLATTSSAKSNLRSLSLSPSKARRRLSGLVKPAKLESPTSDDFGDNPFNHSGSNMDVTNIIDLPPSIMNNDNESGTIFNNNTNDSVLESTSLPRVPPYCSRAVVMYYHRYPLHIERAIYRLSHLKLANIRRPLRQQVQLSNFMYAYLDLINQGIQQEYYPLGNDKLLNFELPSDPLPTESFHGSNHNDTLKLNVVNGSIDSEGSESNGSVLQLALSPVSSMGSSSSSSSSSSLSASEVTDLWSESHGIQ